MPKSDQKPPKIEFGALQNYQKRNLKSEVVSRTFKWSNHQIWIWFWVIWGSQNGTKINSKLIKNHTGFAHLIALKRCGAMARWLSTMLQKSIQKQNILFSYLADLYFFNVFGILSVFWWRHSKNSEKYSMKVPKPKPPKIDPKSIWNPIFWQCFFRTRFEVDFGAIFGSSEPEK